VESDFVAEGWYEDPYRLHAYRWISAGKPSRLVRDGAVESNDPPPDHPFDGPLVPVANDQSRVNGADLLRADEAENGDPNAYSDAAMNAWGQIFPQP
jgi:hypothetical protein